ncbi:MAG: hypothetical protein A2219_06870 [Elusimicrobia bacterium RIFOXYA2_FULL_50_26]|nr:MAG: hypothetical protein A2219_06870 [Elusimicrobia bacterium RIFOXYA2_FULL_50_26]OGS24728.1 MAG: hypothetical protein A2314_05400 [Elusimicrobia bacterium RIFOXYB2_FULL_50_12]
MENLYLHELVNATRGEFLLGDPHAPVRAISIDTRTLHRGDFFFAITGRNFDGHEFIKNAAERLAGGLIVSITDVPIGNPFPFLPAMIKVVDTTFALGDLARYYRKKWNIPLVAITGSNGKTTTKEMLTAILELDSPTLKNAGNHNNQIGVPLTLFNLGHQHRYAVVEMGTSLPGEISRLCDIASPVGGIITNIGLAHIETFKNFDGVFAEKTSLIPGIATGGWVIINADDPYLSRIAHVNDREIIPVSMESKAVVCARDMEQWQGKPVFKLSVEGKTVPVRLPMYGKFNIYNALYAAAAAWKLGARLDQIKQGLEHFKPPAMRMEEYVTANNVTVINDAYNANPSSMRASIDSFIQSFADKRKVIVLADMLELGANAESEHRQLGEFLATRPLDKIFLFGPLMENATGAASAQHFTDRDAMELEIQHYLQPGDAILFKGSRGMRLEVTIAHLFSETGE